MIARFYAAVPLAAILVLAATLPGAAERGNAPGMKEGTMMQDTADSKTGIPPIDVAAPAQIETATFALG